MTPSVSAKFAIRHNPDGSLDAICLKCFTTAGTTVKESGLAAIERTHECDQTLLEARHRWDAGAATNGESDSLSE